MWQVPEPSKFVRTGQNEARTLPGTVLFITIERFEFVSCQAPSRSIRTANTATLTRPKLKLEPKTCADDRRPITIKCALEASAFFKLGFLLSYKSDRSL